MARRKKPRFTVRVAPPANTPVLMQPGSSGRRLGDSVASTERRAPRRPASALPSGRISAVNAARPGQPPQESYSDGEPPPYCPPPLSRRRQRRISKEEENRRLHEQWDACARDNVFRTTCFQAGLPDRQAALKEQLRSEFLAAALATLPLCEACPKRGCQTDWQHVDAACQIVYVSICGRTPVPCPSFRCSGCSAAVRVDPISMGCFPATPQRPQVYFSEALMVLTHSATVSGPTSMVAWISTLEAVHARNGCIPDDQMSGLPEEIWRNLGVAVRQWRRMDAATHDINGLGVQPITPEATLLTDAEDQREGNSLEESTEPLHVASAQVPAPSSPIIVHAAAQPSQPEQSPTQPEQGRSQQQPDRLPAQGHAPGNATVAPATRAVGMRGVRRVCGGPGHVCPCCWRTCIAAIADACLGLTQLRSAGRASDFLQAILPYSPFIPNAEVKAHLAERKQMDPAALERPMCSQFTAATATAADTQLRLYIQVHSLTSHE